MSETPIVGRHLIDIFIYASGCVLREASRRGAAGDGGLSK
jgi:hypothetical protein